MTMILQNGTKKYRTLYSFWDINFKLLLKMFCKTATIGDNKYIWNLEHHKGTTFTLTLPRISTRSVSGVSHSKFIWNSKMHYLIYDSIKGKDLKKSVKKELYLTKGSLDNK